MSDNIAVTAIDDFLVVAGRPAEPGSSEPRLEKRERLTAEALRQAGAVAPAGLLSGSFICAHPPDYRGRPALAWTAAQWRDLFAELKELGMDTVVWQASAWVDLRECYYRSEEFADYRQWNVMEPMLEAARDAKMTVYLGTLGVIRGDALLGVLSGDESRVRTVATREKACYAEIARRFAGGYHGYYISSETWYNRKAATARYTFFNRLYREVVEAVKTLTPGVPVLASPGTPVVNGDEAQAADALTTCFRDAGVDIFAPQDCIGQGNDLLSLPAGLQIWKSVCSALGAEFWVNCEGFRVASYHGAVITIEAADPARFSRQLTLAHEAGAKRMVTWEAMHFMDPRGDEKARRLRQGYLEHRHAVLGRGTPKPRHETGSPS